MVSRGSKQEQVRTVKDGARPTARSLTRARGLSPKRSGGITRKTAIAVMLLALAEVMLLMPTVWTAMLHTMTMLTMNNDG